MTKELSRSPAPGTTYGCARSTWRLNTRCLLIAGTGMLLLMVSLLLCKQASVPTMRASGISAVSGLLCGLAWPSLAQAQDTSNTVATAEPGVGASSTSSSRSVGTATISGQITTYSPQFTPSANVDVGANVLPNIDDPQAVNAQTVCPGYQASNVQRNAYGFNASLTLAGQPCNVYGTDVEDLVLSVSYQTADRLAVSIQPAYLSAENSTQYILSPDIVQVPSQDCSPDEADSSDLQISWTNDPTFAFTVLRQSTGEILFSTEGSKLVFEDQFFEFVTSLPEGYNLYGLGEHLHGLRLGNNYTATFFAADNGNPLDANLYGSHPFYLDTRYYSIDPTTGEQTLVTNATSPASNETSSASTSPDVEFTSRSHGVYLRNAHGLEVLLHAQNLTWRSLGGSIDLYFFNGPTQPEVTSQYLQAVGLPVMQQYWTLGYQQSRWGYKNWSMVEDVVTNFRNYDIPLETIYNDIDYMFQYRDFTNDPNTFSYEEGAEFLDRLSASYQHYIPIVDSAIYIPNPANASDNYSVYDDGHSRDVFLKNPDGSEYIGQVWPGYTVFPDWLSSNVSQWWTDGLQSHHNNVKWSGIWIDMSEVSSFCVGSCGSNNLSLNPVHTPFSLPGEPGQIEVEYPEGFNVTNATEAASASAVSSSQAAATATSSSSASTTTSYLRTTVTPGARNVLHPPYVINNDLGDLSVHAVSPNATHVDGTQEYDIHNTFGHSILKATYNALLTVFPGARPFLFGRSTFAGSGSYAGHWGGDNNSKFGSMYSSISQALSFSLFGVPMFGVDLCGFSGNTDVDLCSRWMALGSFFPFMRNHNVLSALSQEPYRWEDVATATRIALNSRYRLLPYMYTLFHSASTTGSTVLRALPWEFPNDPTLAAVDTQLLLGPALMAIPVLEPNVNFTRGVFPGSEPWYDWYNGSRVISAPGQNVTLDAPRTHLPVYVRGGYVLPMQEAKYTTAECRNSSWGLLVALDSQGKATGQVYVDDGVSIVQNKTLEVDFTAINGTLYASGRGEWVEGQPLANVTVLGMQAAPGNVTLEAGGMAVGVGFTFDSDIGRLSVSGLENVTSNGAFSQDWRLSWA